MVDASPFWTFTLQDLSNGLKNTIMRGVLALAIKLWVFGSPGGLQVPTFGSVSFILTFSPKWGCDTLSCLSPFCLGSWFGFPWWLLDPVPWSPPIAVGMSGGLGGRCFGRALCYPFTPCWGNACGNTSVPNWDSRHYEVWTKCPNLRHLRHWFGSLDYRILCSVVSFIIAPFAMEGIQIYPAACWCHGFPLWSWGHWVFLCMNPLVLFLELL